MAGVELTECCVFAMAPWTKLVFLAAVLGISNSTLFSHLQDENLDTAGLVSKYGYPIEIHQVNSSDGYILTMFRIPYGKHSPDGRPKKVILLQHGLLLSSASWVIMGPDKGLAYVLADAGFDVWMGNVRGNRYSRKHVSKTPYDESFWDFSWHEQAIHDVPAEIDYILHHTEESKIFYAGHSMGTTMFYVMCSERPEYNSKIRVMFSLSPVGFMNHMMSPFLQIAAQFSGVLSELTNVLGVGEFDPAPSIMKTVGDTFCVDGAITQILCTSTIFLICGFDSQELNTTTLPVIMAHAPAGASTKQVLHYIQEIKSGHFRKWDYGPIGNLKHYGSLFPPDYHLRKVVAPVIMFYSKNDWLSNPTDVDRLDQALGNVVEKYLVPFDAFNHLDYLWAIHGKNLVYNKIISMSNRF